MGKENSLKRISTSCSFSLTSKPSPKSGKQGQGQHTGLCVHRTPLSQLSPRRESWAGSKTKTKSKWHLPVPLQRWEEG